MKVRIAIVDDLKQDTERLEECLRNFFEKQKAGASAGNSAVIEKYSSAEEFLPAFEPGRFELVFLDILMDEMNGIELARELRAKDHQLMIVFQTTERSYAFDAFPIHPFDYLIKPCRQDEVDGVLTEAMRVLEAGDPEIEVTAIRAKYSVPLRSIIALISQGRNVEISLTNNQRLTCTDTFRNLSAKVENDPRFLLINRGVIVNMDHVLAPQKDSMEMKDGCIYPIRINGRAAVISEFSQYMISKVDKRG